MRQRRTLTRRQFLCRSAGIFGAALAAPSIIPASALGRNRATAPSDRITMGFIGVGTQGGGHLLGGAWTYLTGGYAAREDVQVLAVCDVWRDRREQAQFRVNQHYAEVFGRGNYRSCEAYVDFRSLLDRPDIDAVLIATPAHWHAVMAVMAAQAGKDIYCEKPTAVTVRESQAVLAAVRRYGRIYQAGTQQRSEYSGYFRRASEYVRSGRIGKRLFRIAHARDRQNVLALRIQSGARGVRGRARTREPGDACRRAHVRGLRGTNASQTAEYGSKGRSCRSRPRTWLGSPGYSPLLPFESCSSIFRR
ncbi:MAG: Gfo/Idh/MocA family oxidoreductase [Acidobacteriia bacterium]|nr:Gfo/Idh/MocA family oxidoreductase [Terriglobia bacterium]